MHFTRVEARLEQSESKRNNGVDKSFGTRTATYGVESATKEMENPNHGEYQVDP